MIIDVSDILKEVGAIKEFKGEVLLQNMLLSGEPLKFLNPLTIKGNILNSGGTLLLDARVIGEIMLQCGSCAELFVHDLNFCFQAELKATPEEDDPDIFVYQGDHVSIRDIIAEFLLLELPIRRRCKEDCKGICPDCGKNLNLFQCECEEEDKSKQEEEIDSRLLSLKKFFSTQGKEV